MGCGTGSRFDLPTAGFRLRFKRKEAEAKHINTVHNRSSLAWRHFFSHGQTHRPAGFSLLAGGGSAVCRAESGSDKSPKEEVRKSDASDATVRADPSRGVDATGGREGMGAC